MKKILALILAILFICAVFCSCTDDDISDKPPETTMANNEELESNGRRTALMKEGKIPDLEWPIFRGNRNYSGHTDGIGNIISEPREAAYIDMGMYDAYISLSGFAGENIISYKTNEAVFAAPGDIDESWGLLNFQRIEIDGEFVTVTQSQTVKYAQMYKSSEKYYLVEVTETPFNTRQDFSSNLVRMYEYGKTGRGELLWEEPLPEYIERPQLCVYDMTGNGNKDIIVVGWQGAAVMDAYGNQVSFLPQSAKGWHQLRKRGYVCAADIDGDGYGEIVIIGCFPYHVDMINFDGKDLSFGWTHIFDDKIERAFKVSKALTNSVGDFDGDGKYEVLVNVFNDEGDGKWHSAIYEAASGEKKYDIPGAYAYNIADADGDGKHEIFCIETTGQAIPQKGTLKVYEIRENMPSEIFSIKEASYIKPRIYANPDNVAVHGGTAPEGEGLAMLTDEKVLLADIDGDGMLEFFAKTYNDDGSTAITAYKTKNGKIEAASLEIAIPAGIKGDIARADKYGALLLKLRSMGDGGFEVKITGMEPENLGRYKADSYHFSAPIAADIDNDGFLDIIAANDIGQLVCWKKTESGFDELWRVEGRGMTNQYYTDDYGACAADANGDGFKEILLAGEGETGAAIQLCGHDGKLIWSHEFKDIYAGPVETFNGNIAFFNFVKMSENGGLDIAVTVQRVIQHTGKTYILSGKDGSIIYEYDEIEVPEDGLSPGGMGGYCISSCDIDGDGFDELFGGYGNAVWGIDGKTGEYLFKRFMTGMYTSYNKNYQKQFPNFWVSAIIPMPFKDKNSGEYKLFAGHAGLGGGSFGLDGRIIKAAEIIETDGARWQALADIDGDGGTWVAEICGGAENQSDVSLRVYDPVTLEPYPGGWIKQPELHTPAYSYVVSGDINGDGKDEVLFNSYDGALYCCGIKADGSFGELWKHSVGKTIGSLSLADADGDGYIEIMVSAMDGSILILG